MRVSQARPSNCKGLPSVSIPFVRVPSMPTTMSPAPFICLTVLCLTSCVRGTFHEHALPVVLVRGLVGGGTVVGPVWVRVLVGDGVVTVTPGRNAAPLLHPAPTCPRRLVAAAASRSISSALPLPFCHIHSASHRLAILCPFTPLHSPPLPSLCSFKFLLAMASFLRTDANQNGESLHCGRTGGPVVDQGQAERQRAAPHSVADRESAAGCRMRASDTSRSSAGAALQSGANKQNKLSPSTTACSHSWSVTRTSMCAMMLTLPMSRHPWSETTRGITGSLRCKGPQPSDRMPCTVSDRPQFLWCVCVCV